MAVVVGHFGVDVLNSSGAVLLAALAGSLALSNAQIGLALTWYTLAGSLSQPLFGWFADRTHQRPGLLGGLGLVWMALGFSAVAFAQNWALLLPCFVLAALGSGLFHPIGTANAAVAHPTRAGSATAVFFFCGQLGLALGPVLTGLLYRAGGGLGVLALCIAMFVPVGLLVTVPRVQAVAATAKGAARRAAVQAGWFVLGSFVLLVALRSSIQAVYAAFLPKLFADRGWDTAAYGLLAGTFMLTAAIGNLVTGTLADRYGMRVATVPPLLLGVPAGLLCLWAPTPATAFVASGLAGLLLGGQHSVLVVHAQRLIPAGQGFAAGLILGFTFAAGAIGTWLCGISADYWGLLAAMQVITLLGVPAALLALTLPGRKRAMIQPAVEANV